MDFLFFTNDIRRRKTPRERNISATLKTGKFQIAIKSTTPSRKTRSKKFPTAPPKKREYPPHSKISWKGFFLR